MRGSRPAKILQDW